MQPIRAQCGLSMLNPSGVG